VQLDQDVLLLGYQVLGPIPVNLAGQRVRARAGRRREIYESRYGLSTMLTGATFGMLRA